MTFSNIYEDSNYAAAYSSLDFGGTYLLAYRDLPEILQTHVVGTQALDFGCGAGRSTRFFRQLGFDVIGCDISSDMIKLAHEHEPHETFIHIPPADFGQFESNSFDLITAIYPFDNIPTREEKMKNLLGLKNLLKPTGKLLLLVSSSKLYVNEWESFSSKHWPENKNAKSGDPVQIAIMTIGDERPVTDILFTEEDYHALFRKADLVLERTYKPLADGTEPYQWVVETEIAPWEIHVLGR